MLGRFLEVSVHAPNALESLQFYQGLGFTTAEVGDTWKHPYGVVTDGRLSIGLHQYEFESPSLTFVKPDLGKHLQALEQQGIEFAFRKLGDNVFNEAGFRDPNQLMVTLLEARTFSPLAPGRTESTCGYFAEFGIPSRDFERSKVFWERLGFVGLQEHTDPFRRLPLTSDFLDLGLYDSQHLRSPVLTFIEPDMPNRIAQLLQKGIETARLPPGFDRNRTALLVAPEGTALLLMTGET